MRRAGAETAADWLRAWFQLIDGEALRPLAAEGIAERPERGLIEARALGDATLAADLPGPLRPGDQADPATARERDRTQPWRDPYLAPEIVLLFKAKARRDKDEADLALTLPSLTPDRIRWLRQALRIVYPEHEWIRRLTTAS